MPRRCSDLPALGARLRAARDAKGLSQIALGEALGLAQATISAYERGGEIDSSVLRAIASELEIPREEWGDLLDLAGTQAEAAA
jgi:transcriptional regulator with XRE-family HTH domain